jgi:sugar (glycoside-pentoside-hexuronide) transporter
MTSQPPGSAPQRPATSAPGIGEKLGFFGGSVGTFLINGAAGFVLVYLSDDLALSAAAVGTMLLVMKVLDGVIDSGIGFTVDHLPWTRWGRFRPYTLIGAALAALGVIAFYTLPGYLPNPLLVAWIVYPLMGAGISTLVIPLVSLVPAVSHDARTRSQLAAFVGFTTLLSSTVAAMVTLPAVAWFGGGPRGWAIYGVAMATVGFLLVVWLVTRVRERVVPASPHRYGLAEVGRVFFSDWAVAILFGCKVVVYAASGVLLTGGPFYFIYYMGNRDLFTVAAAVMAVPMGVSAIGFPALARRHGLKPWYVVGLAAAILGLGSLYFIPPEDVVVVMMLFAVAGVGFGGVTSLNYVMLSELTDYVEWRHGYRAEATLAALASFAVKAGSGIGAGIVGWVLAWGGFDGSLDVQSDQAVRAVLFSMSAIPALIGIAGALMFWAYPVTREIAEEAHRAVADRRGAPLPDAAV